uniref:Uncharacterized protein n=1 Tax=Percolomonas cosmopolitus TaxID=63605 RepID=A0A7S1KS59_9EUKA|mmetsp:Transcript_7174/g.26885  ORF Transcript_7174/g.26885 Transcript_7174/m.26885 type:complete len:1562 (+) Transcript_7174:5157-9842(+)
MSEKQGESGAASNGQLEEWRQRKPPYRARTAPTTQRRRRDSKLNDNLDKNENGNGSLTSRVNRKRKTMNAGTNEAYEGYEDILVADEAQRSVNGQQNPTQKPLRKGYTPKIIPKPHPFSARVQSRRPNHDISAISRDQQHSNRRRGFPLVLAEADEPHTSNSHITAEEQTPTSAVSSFSQFSAHTPLISGNIANQLFSEEEFPLPTSQGHNANKRASSSAMMFHSSASQFMRDSPFSGGLISDGAITSMGLQRGSSSNLDNNSLDSGVDFLRGFSASGLSSTTNSFSHSGPLSSNIRSREGTRFRRRYSLMGTERDDAFPRASKKKLNHKTSALPYIGRTRAHNTLRTPKTSSSGSTFLPSHQAPSTSNLIQEMLLLDHESLELERHFQYFEAIHKMQECIAVMKEVYGSWRHEQISQYVERCVAMCNTYANQYMYGSAFGDQGRTQSKHDVPISDLRQHGDMNLAYQLLKTALRYCREQSPFFFQSKPALLILTWNNVASYFRKIDELEKAQKYARKAFDYKRSKQNANHKNIRIADNPAGVELNLGAILSLMGHHHESLKFSRMALNILLDEDLLIDDVHRIFPDEHTRRKTFPLFSSLVIVHHNIAVELEHLGKMEEAFRWHVKAATIARTKLGDTSELAKEMQYVLEEFERVCRKGNNANLMVDTFTGSHTALSAEGPGAVLPQFDRVGKLIHSPMNANTRQHTPQLTRSPGGSGPMETSYSTHHVASSVQSPTSISAAGGTQWDQLSFVASIARSESLHTDALPSRDLVILDGNRSISKLNTQKSASATQLRPTPPSTLAKSSSYVRRVASSKINSTNQKPQKQTGKIGSHFVKPSKLRKGKSRKRLRRAEDIYLHQKVIRPSAPHPAQKNRSFQRKFKHSASKIGQMEHQDEFSVNGWVDSKESISENGIQMEVQSGKSSSLSRHMFHIHQRQNSVHHKAAIIIQNAWRVYVAKQESSRRRAFVIMYSALTIQSLFRGYLLRRALSKRIGATEKIQNWFRVCRAQKQNAALSSAVVKIQRNFRKWRVSQDQDLRRLNILIVQRTFRRFLETSRTQKRTQNALIIQKNWRAAQQKLYLIRLTSVTIFVQKLWRQRMMSKRMKQEFKLHVTVLKLWKMKKIREVHLQQSHSAALIQRWWRLRRDQKYFCSLQWTCSLLKPYIQMMSVRRLFISLQRGAVSLQSHHRRRRIMKSMCVSHQATNLIARQWKKYQIRKEMHHMFCSTVVIQRAIRRYQSRTNLMKLHNAATRIQTCWRKYLAKMVFRSTSATVIPIQRTWRIFVARKRIHCQFTSQISISRVWRGFVCRRDLEKQSTAALRIQCLARGMLARQYCAQFACPATKLQSIARTVIAQNHLRERHVAALVISRFFKGYQVRKAMDLQRASVERIQRWTRVRMSVRHVQELKEASQRQEAIIMIQAWWRMHCDKMDQDVHRNACIVLQSWAKRLVHLRRFQLTRKSAAIVQRVWKSHSARNQLHEAVLSATRLQSWWRVQLAIRELHDRREHSARMHAATQIQRVWRSSATRHQMQRENALVAQIQHMWMVYRRRRHSRILQQK